MNSAGLAAYDSNGTRTFFIDKDGYPVMMKAVVDERKLKGPLDKYFAVTTFIFFYFLDTSLNDVL